MVRPSSSILFIINTSRTMFDYYVSDLVCLLDSHAMLAQYCCRRIGLQTTFSLSSKVSPTTPFRPSGTWSLARGGLLGTWSTWIRLLQCSCYRFLRFVFSSVVLGVALVQKLVLLLAFIHSAMLAINYQLRQPSTVAR